MCCAAAKTTFVRSQHTRIRSRKMAGKTAFLMSRMMNTRAIRLKTIPGSHTTQSEKYTDQDDEFSFDCASIVTFVVTFVDICR
ncbi:hypothetical protein DPMN_055769 [Dreissena polymorpha]|uniref:Uncharacterized protein n=1 Tax=Dreissena polymorpha TaxID=45954 RepID=A0A9D4HSW0_DREPO|nr:hypothetical protein DPMN_055769 [Dreissena polymorpha]